MRKPRSLSYWRVDEVNPRDVPVSWPRERFEHPRNISLPTLFSSYTHRFVHNACFQAVLQEHVRNTVISDDQTREELQEIMQFFPKSAQHFQ